MLHSGDAWNNLINFKSNNCDNINKNYNYLKSFQRNGTKYLKNLRIIDNNLQNQLDVCAGEIYLCCIPSKTCIEQVAQVAAILGEIYVLRFKVNYADESRGFAYLQYMNPSLMATALIKLPALFQQYSLPSIRVLESRNCSKLLLKKADELTPQEVYDTLREVIHFNKLVGFEIYRNHFEYEIIFDTNDEAINARRELLRSLYKFGQKAIILWDTEVRRQSNNTNNKTNQMKKKKNGQLKDKDTANEGELPRNQNVAPIVTSTAFINNNYSIMNNYNYTQNHNYYTQFVNYNNNNNINKQINDLSQQLKSNFSFNNFNQI